ncbi:hypothetical protein [Pedobacter zeae]|uniref:Uncharacterized protein n=1 Tax=Pedobacter zeae TaxID=1737356 RepID=A0A7W6P8M9_9SPHI|nr:hypothetical protein [Pedobacter zeae]MBB4110271.1 hypothetical protein [Pedobacter zeae]GGH17036.1 hypothetical protein GCM10007422_40140 [Pedobacter zeae]
MRVLKYALLSALTVYGFSILRKRTAGRKSFAVDLTKQIPGYIGEVKQYWKRVKLDYSQTSDLY